MTDARKVVVQMRFSGGVGGAETVAFSLARTLSGRIDDSILYLIVEDRSGHKATQTLEATARSLGTAIRVFHTSTRWSTALLSQMAAALDADQVRIIHAHCYKSACYAWTLKRLLKRPIRVIFTLHGLFDPFTLRSAAIHGAHVLGLLGADRIVGCSEEIAGRYSSIPFIGRKVETIQNCMATDERHEPDRVLQARTSARQRFASQWALDGSKVWVATVGRLTEQKNHALFLDVASEVVKGHGLGARAHFLIVGDGNLRRELEAKTAAMSMTEHVTFTSFVAEMDTLWPALDLLLLTSRWEGTPMCVLEAMAYGKPVISTAVGGVPGVVREGRTGYLVKNSDAKELGNIVKRLLDDDAQRLTLGAAALYDIKTRLSPQRWADAHVKLYDKVLES